MDILTKAKMKAQFIFIYIFNYNSKSVPAALTRIIVIFTQDYFGVYVLCMY